MSFFITLVAILQSFSISLGVGSSTLAIINFFAAIADGTIDPSERRMMGIVYVVLRIAMVAILATTVLLLAIEYSSANLWSLSGFAYAQILVIFVLYVNALLMTAHLVPSTFGPAIQAGSWYTLGTLAALASLQITTFGFLQFLLAYIAWIVLAIGIVNGVMAIMKSKQQKKPKK